MNIKEIGRLEGEIVRHFSADSSPVMVLDTSGLIDITTALRQYSFSHRNGDRNKRYEKPIAFLENLSQALPIIITPKTYQEIHNHGRTRLNGHAIELTPNVVDFALNRMTDSIKIIDKLKPRASLDDARYDAYWAAKHGCDGNHKKYVEGCSDTDKEILATAAYISTSQFNYETNPEINPILVVSSDAHIINGTEFLKRGFDGKYSAMVPFSTRH